jgi:hypothetical protein
MARSPLRPSLLARACGQYVTEAIGNPEGDCFLLPVSDAWLHQPPSGRFHKRH